VKNGIEAEMYHEKKRCQDAMAVSIWEEIVMDTLEMLLKAQFPTMILVAASLLLLIHPSQPTHTDKTVKTL